MGDTLKQLVLEEKLVELEIQSLQEKLLSIRTRKELIISFDLATTVTNEPMLKSKAIPSQTADGKEMSSPLTPVALAKSKMVILGPIPHGKTSKLVNCEPKSSDKSLSSPTANGSGKDSSNPLSPVDLGKIKSADSAPKFSASYLDAVAGNGAKERFYVIFNGNHAGIYNNWGIVSKLISGTTSSYKKYTTLMQADQYTKKFSGPAIVYKDSLVPVTKVKESHRPVMKIQPKETKAEKQTIVLTTTGDIFLGLDYEDFMVIWYKSRNIGPEDLEAEHVYTDDSKTRSLMNFLPGADPKLISLAWQAGLTRNIYPSANLQEIKLLPKGVKKSIRDFRKKIAKAADAEIYVQVTSSIPDWSEGRTYSPYYFIEIGLRKEMKIKTSISMEENREPAEGLRKLRVDGLKLILAKSRCLNSESKAKINYCSSHCVIASWTKTSLTKDEEKSLAHYERLFLIH